MQGTSAEETTQSSASILESSSTTLNEEVGSQTPEQGTETSNSGDVQKGEVQQTTELQEKKTAIIDGEVVELEPPVKEGQSEANNTEAPKEELVQENRRATHAISSTIQLYRLYNPNSGEHFYTKTTGERDNLRKVGWHYEGVGWVAPSTGNPVYRLYNPNAGDHHYTLNKRG